MRRTQKPAAAAMLIAATLAWSGGCAPSRDAGAPAPGSAAPAGGAGATAPPAGPRYACEYDPDPRNMTDCDLESKVVRAEGDGGMMQMLEVTRYPGVEPTPEQRRAADDMVKRCYESAARHGWYDFDKATADGFRLKVSDDTHYNNIEFLFDDRVLDPDRPEYLMFYDTPTGAKVLAGFMFVPRNNTEEGPQFGGPLTRWHYHTWGSPICLVKGILDTGPPVDGRCAMGALSYRSPEMIHVWLLDHPQGPFATGMYLSDELLDRLVRERAAQKAPRPN